MAGLGQGLGGRLGGGGQHGHQRFVVQATFDEFLLVQYAVAVSVHLVEYLLSTVFGVVGEASWLRRRYSFDLLAPQHLLYGLK